MAFTEATVSYNLADYVGEDYDFRRTKGWIVTNIESGYVVDDATGDIRVTEAKVSVDANGEGSVIIPVPGSTNPETWQTTFYFDLPEKGRHGKRRVLKFGPFTITETSILGALVEEQAVPTEYVTQVTEQLQTYSDAAAISASDAEAAATQAQAARDEAQALILEDLGTSDGQVAFLIDTPTSQTAQRLTASYVRTLRAPTGVGSTDTAELLAAASAGGFVKTRPGTYVLEGMVDLVLPIWLDIDKRTTFRLANGAADGAGDHAVFRIQSSGVALAGGVLDANRAGQNKAAFNTAGGAPGGRGMYGVIVEGADGSPLDNVLVDTHVINSADTAVKASYLSNSTVRAHAEDSGRGVSGRNCSDTLFEVTCRSIDNDGWKVLPHVFDLFWSDRCTVRLHSSDHYGTGTVAGGTALDDYISGVTITDCFDLTVDGAYVETRNVNGMSKGVGFSLLSLRRAQLSNITAVGYSDVSLELGGVVDTGITNLLLDGRYQTATGGSTGRGVAAYDNGFVPDAYTGRAQVFTDGLTVTNFHIRRHLGDAIDIWRARDTKWINGRVIGNNTGLVSKHTIPTGTASEFVGHLTKDLAGHLFEGVDFDFNEQHGVAITDMSRGAFTNCRARNNGQSLFFGSTRRGVAVEATATGFVTLATATAGLSKTDLVWVGCDGDDTQVTGAATWGSPNPSNLALLSIADDSKVSVGQTLELVGAGPAGANLKVRVNDKSVDEITVAPTPSVSPAVAGTGTIAASGTTLTGSGTAFDTELTARAWITAAGQTRRLARVASATSATVDTPFSPAVPAGTAFTIHKTIVNTAKSQKYGFGFSADTIDPRLAFCGQGAGNILGPVNDATVTATRLRTWGIPGQTHRVKGPISTTGNVTATADGSAVSMGSVGPDFKPGFALAGDTNWYRDGAARLKTDGKFVAGQGVGVGNSAAAATLGTLSRKMEVFDAAGASLGFVPIYTTIT